MGTKTDNLANVGRHKFEVAGLGLAPFRFTGVSEKVHKAGDVTKAGGSCDYCFTGIRYEFHILSADGKASKVGCDCIAKVGDEGLLRAYKSSPEFRKLQADKRRAKAAAVLAELMVLIETHKAQLAAMAHPHGFTDRQTGRALTMLDQAVWLKDNCGAAGRASTLRKLKKLINQ